MVLWTSVCIASSHQRTVKKASGATPREEACPHPLRTNSGITVILTAVLEDLPFQIGGKKGTHIHVHMICEFAYLKLNKPCSSYAGI